MKRKISCTNYSALQQCEKGIDSSRKMSQSDKNTPSFSSPSLDESSASMLVRQNACSSPVKEMPPRFVSSSSFSSSELSNCPFVAEQEVNADNHREKNLQPSLSVDLNHQSPLVGFFSSSSPSNESYSPGTDFVSNVLAY